MTEKKYKYYAVLDDRYTREDPFTLLRRVVMPDGGYGRDETLSPKHDWKYSTLLRSSERGDTQFEFVEIDENEAMQIKERFLGERESHGGQAPQG